VIDLAVTFPGPAEVQALSRVNLTVGRGQLAAVIGPSGCGKSTLFNALAGLTPIAGDIVLEGKRVPHLRGRAAYMQQKDLLLPWRSALDNAVLGLEIQGLERAAARRRAADMLAEFGLADFIHRYPAELSGGMRQRVALVRTILCGRDIWLLDEPFAALDAITRRHMQHWLAAAWAGSQAAVILVTHDVEEALLLADRIYVMSARPGSILEGLSVNRPRPRLAVDPELAGLKVRLLELLDSAVGDRA
jgi:ABC-type nitrate/sulfonate/bicarbonate transport system ATPase subunit